MDSVFGMLMEPSTSIPLGIFVAVALVVAIERLLAVSAPFHQKWPDSTRLQNLKHATEILGNLDGNQPAKNAMHAYVLKQSLILQENSKSIEPDRVREVRISDVAILVGIGIGLILSAVSMEAYFNSPEFEETSAGATGIELVFGYAISAAFILFMVVGTCIGILGGLVGVSAHTARYVRRRLSYLLTVLNNRDQPDYMI